MLCNIKQATNYYNFNIINYEMRNIMEVNQA